MIDLARYQQFVGTQAIIEFEHSADLAKAAEALGPFIGSEFPGSLAPAGDPSAFSIRTKNAALTITAQKAVIEAQYYGNHTKDYELCHGYLSRKMRALYRGITEGMGRSANFFALITETRASFSGLSDLPVDWIRDRFLRFDSESDLVDLVVRIGTKRTDRYYVNFEVNAYQQYVFRPVGPPPAHGIVRLNELDVDDFGVRVAIDVNTKQESFRHVPTYSVQDLEAFLDITRTIVLDGMPSLLSGGK